MPVVEPCIPRFILTLSAFQSAFCSPRPFLGVHSARSACARQASEAVIDLTKFRVKHLHMLECETET